MAAFILQVACDIPVAVSASGVFDYLPFEGMAEQDCLGRAVLVGFGAQTIVGIVVGSSMTSDMPLDKLKRIQAIIPFVPRADAAWLGLVRFIALYYQRGLGEVALPSLPVALRQARNFVRDETSGEVALRTGQAAWKKWQKMSPVPTPIDLAASLPLTAAQTEVINALREADHQPQLLFGVTGSGKTEVYLQYLAEILQADETAQVLILVPEINLTPQLAARLNERFGADAVVTLHSKLTESTRLMNVWRTASGQARVILGTRLAVLAMLPNL